MIARIVESLLRRRLKANPATVLVGPRQSGKTTLARSLPGVYFDLEQPADRLRLDLQWDELVAARHLIILDEAQTWPELFPRLRGAIDAGRRRNGRFLLLGSVSPALMKHVAESLAGRLALAALTPFLISEQPDRPPADFWLRGGFPDGGIRNPGRFPQWQQDYLTLLSQRDLPAWGMPAKPPVTQRLLRMLAALGEAGEAHYFRTQDGYEVDLVFKLGSRLWAVEIKLSASPSPEDYSRFNLAANLIGADRRYLVAQVARSSLSKTGGVLSLPHLLDVLAKELR